MQRGCTLLKVPPGGSTVQAAGTSTALTPLHMLAQFEAFAKGFMMLCGGPAIHLFSATELERLVCGNPLLDFRALQASARYDGGYHAEHKVRLPTLPALPAAPPHLPMLPQGSSLCADQQASLQSHLGYGAHSHARATSHLLVKAAWVCPPGEYVRLLVDNL